MKVALPSAGILACVLATSAALHGAQAADLKVTDVTLSSAGLAEIRQEAVMTDDGTLELAVPLDQVDDILKSLVVYDPMGTVTSISLPGREPLSEAFRALPFGEADLASLPALLSALRGRTVTVDGYGRKARGRIVGVERAEGRDGEVVHRLTLLAEDGAVGSFVVEAASAITFDDPEVEKMIASALSASGDARAAEARTVSISLDGTGERAVALSYVVAAPVWKSAYRLVLPQEDGEARLQGWAIVENMTGHNWDDVALSLSSGRPVALRQALYEAYRLHRPEIPVSAFGQVLPRPDHGTLRAAAGNGTGLDLGRATKTMATMAPPSPESHMFANGVEEAASRRVNRMARGSQSAQADESMTAVRFDFPQTMDVPAGHSLTVPFLDESFDAERVSVYQPDVDGVHPIAAVRLRNDGESSLPPGILTFYAAPDGYAGDAQFLGAGPGENRLLTFAVDRKVRVMADRHDDSRLRSASVVDGVLRAESIRRAVTEYAVSGAMDGDRTVVIEHPRRHGWTSTVTGGVREDTATHVRVSVEVPAGGNASVIVVNEKPEGVRYELDTMEPRSLIHISGILKGVDGPLSAALAELSSLRSSAANAERRFRDAEQSIKAIASDQQRLRSNLEAVPDDSELARRYLARLAEQEDRVDAAQGAREEALADMQAADERVRKAVRRLAE